MSQGGQRRLERSFSAAVQDVWELWTTPAGIEAWWGPPGFAVTVQSMDLRPGGQLFYTMTAVGAEQIAFMQRANMPVSTPAQITFLEVTPMRRLAYRHRVDFVPGVEAYDVTTQVEFVPLADEVRLILTLDAMHDQTWTDRAVAGWEGELGKLAALIARRAS